MSNNLDSEVQRMKYLLVIREMGNSIAQVLTEVLTTTYRDKNGNRINDSTQVQTMARALHHASEFTHREVQRLKAVRMDEMDEAHVNAPDLQEQASALLNTIMQQSKKLNGRD